MRFLNQDTERFQKMKIENRKSNIHFPVSNIKYPVSSIPAQHPGSNQPNAKGNNHESPNQILHGLKLPAARRQFGG